VHIVGAAHLSATSENVTLKNQTQEQSQFLHISAASDKQRGIF
jgi:hypothetical protein